MAEQPTCLPDQITREQLHAYLDESLGERELSLIERTLRSSPELQLRLEAVRSERDRGEHSVGQIWRRERLTCPTREQLSGDLLGVHDTAFSEYIRFHIEVIGCPFCLANRTDLRQQLDAGSAPPPSRRMRVFQSSAGMLPPPKPDRK